jgi:hypothetical protein
MAGEFSGPDRRVYVDGIIRYMRYVQKLITGNGRDLRAFSIFDFDVFPYQ